MRVRMVYTVLAAFLAAAVAGCGGGGSDGGTTNGGSGETSKVTLTGTITVAPAASAARAAGVATPDAVWAIPVAKIQGLNIDPVNLKLRKTSSIASDGGFSFELSKTITIEEVEAVAPEVNGQFPAGTTFDVDWLLVLMSGETPLGVIALQGDTSFDELVSLPISVFDAVRMDLGSVDPSNGTAALSVGGIAGDLNLAADSLAALARSDDILRVIQDVIRNCDLSTGRCISARQSFVFMGDYTAITDTVSFDRADTYTGYQFYLDLSDVYDSTDFDGMCPTSGAAAVEYRLTPPGAITIEGSTYDVSTPLATGSASGSPQDINNGAATECFKTGQPIYLRKSSTDWQLQFITGDTASQLTTVMPAGDWILGRKGTGESAFTEVARFEFDLASPVDANGNPIVVVPGVRFETGANGELTTLHVKWYRYTAGGYVEVTDTAFLQSIIGGFGISLDDFDGTTGSSGRRSAQQNDIGFATASIDVSDLDGNGPFYYNSSDPARYNLDYFGISYQFGGQGFRFAWRNN